MYLLRCILEQLCDLTTDSGNYNVRFYSDRSALARSARALLSSVTRVLLIADTVVVKQLLTAKDRVSISLNRLENVANFTEFVKAYAIFGSEMVELAHLVSDRSNCSKDERRRAEMGSARRFLERSTMMLLTSAKACLRHPDCESAKENRDTVFIEMRRAMDSIHSVIKDSVLPQLTISAFNLDSCGHPRRSHGRSSHGHVSRYSSSNRSTPDWMIDNDDEPLTTAFNAIKRFEEWVELSRITLCKGLFRERLISAFDAFVELTQDFTDSAYTRHENREKLLLLCDRTKIELNQLLRLGICLDESGTTNPTSDLEEAILHTLRAVNDVKLQLRNTALEQADELFRLTDEFDIINQLRNTFLTGDPERLNDYVKIFSDHCDHVGEVCRLLHNVTTSETLQIYSKITENHINVFSPQVLNACFTLCAYPNSRIAKDNLEVFLDFWIILYSDVHQYVKDTRECSTGVDLSGNYANYPGNGSCSQSGSVRWPGIPNTKGAQQVQAQQSVQQQVSSQSQQTVQQQQPVILGPNGSMDPNDPTMGHGKVPGSVDLETGETDKNWPSNNASEDNDIVRRAKAMSQMALNMNQFTRGEGDLKTTQDLFTQAEFLAEEANKFYKLVRHFSYQVPSGLSKKDLLDNLDKVPTFVQQLQFTVKQPTVGKAATFTKVDNVIKEAKNLMMFVCSTVDSCINCASKFNLDMGAARARSRTLSPSGRHGEDDSGYEGMSSGMGSKSGTASSDPNI
uniref:Alpha-catulin n=1 Tax=Tetranychus urticae TaxID=32264 RepID=T1JSM0_TETUR